MSAPESWLGKVPTHWQVRRLGTLETLRKGSGGSKGDNRDVGLPVVRYGEIYTRFETVITRAHSFIDEEAALQYTSLPTGTIVFAGSGEDVEDIGKSALSLLEQPAYVGGDTVLFTPQGGESHPLYLAYALESRPLKALKAIRSTGFTVVHITAGKLKTLPIPLPPPAEQRAIADHLDCESAQIDTLIAEQQRLIELLRERRLAVASDVIGARVGNGDRLKWLLTGGTSSTKSGNRASISKNFNSRAKPSRVAPVLFAIRSQSSSTNVQHATASSGDHSCRMSRPPHDAHPFLLEQDNDAAGDTSRRRHPLVRVIGSATLSRGSEIGHRGPVSGTTPKLLSCHTTLPGLNCALVRAISRKGRLVSILWCW